MEFHEEIDELLKGMENNKQPIIDAAFLPIHRQLKLKRIHDDFTQTELAALIGCGLSTLSEIENGRRRIPYKYLERVKNYLYCEMYHNKEFIGPVSQDW
jgi:transcriptional regulator with XRE-family HTH domain